MKYKRQLRCIKDYEEDLTGDDDFATVWTAGKVYGAIKQIPPEKLLILSRITHSYLQTLITKKNTWENIKSDMRLKCVKGKEYICMIGKWEEYLRYLENEIKKME